MASTYSTNLAIELIGTGDQAGTWGVTTNTNLGTLIEQAISGYVTQAVATGTDTTITIPNGATGVARNMFIEMTGTGGAATNLIVPANKKLYFIYNNSTGAVTVKVSGQTGVSVPQGKKMILVSNGTDVVAADNYIADFGSNSATITQLTSTSGTITTLASTSASITNLTAGSLVLSNLSISSANITTLTSSSATITNLLGTTLTISGNSFLATSSGNVGIGTTSPNLSSVTRALTISSGTSASTTSAIELLGNTNATDAALGAIRFYNTNSSNVQVASIAGRTDSASNSGYIQFATASSGTLAEKMRLDSSGNVGIGTSSPSTRLTVSGTTTINTAADATAGLVVKTFGAGGGTQPIANFQRSDAAINFQIGFNGTNGDTFAGTTTNHPLAFLTNNTERMRLDSSGNLGLGVTPSAWSGVGPALQFGTSGAIISNNANSTSFISNAYYDGANYKYINTAFAARLAMTSGAYSFQTAPSGTAGNAITFTTAMTLDAAGRLLLGVTSGAGNATLDLVANSGAGAINIRGRSSDNASSVYFYSNDNATLYSYISQNAATDFQLRAYANIPMVFYTNNAERARITAGGDFLVGTTSTTSPGAVLGSNGRVSGTTAATGTSCFQAWNQDTAGDNIFVQFYTEGGGGTLRGSIDYNRAGGLVRYNTTSDYRAKDVYGLLERTGSAIDALKVYNGKMKGATQERPMLIAHEAQEVAPYAVSGVKDEENEDGTPKYQQMDHSSLVPLLIAEIQSLRARVAALESK